MMNLKALYKRFVQWLAESEIQAAVQARLNALAVAFPEFAKLLADRQAASAKAKATAESQREALLKQVASLDEEIQKHEDFEAAVELLTGK